MNRCLTLGVRTSWLVFLVVVVLATSTAASAQSVPSGWSARDIGSVGASGSSSGSGGSFTVRGAGADIWGTADAFQFAYRTMTGDGEVVTHVRSIDYIHAWSKAGVMVRESLNAGAKHAYMLVSAGKGDAFQRRPYTDGSSVNTGADGGPGYFVKITRAGNNFDAYQSTDGSNWNWVASEWIDMPSTIYAGLAVSSHVYGVPTNATFTETAVNEWSTTPASGNAMPSGWAQSDIGAVAAGGWAAANGNDFQVGGSGADIWDGVDAFHYGYRTMTGDGSIVARVNGVDWTDQWAKGGVMMRESLSPSSTHAFMLVSAGNGVAFQRRPYTGGASVHTGGAGVAAPYYVKLVRSGNTFTGYQSPDGSNWSTVGSEYIAMGSTIYVGLAVTSHANGAIANGSFSAVEVVEGATAPSVPVSNPVVPASGGNTLRVMQWNVHHGGIGTDGVYDPDRVAAWIASVNPDVVSLNEVDDVDELNNIVWALNARTGISWASTWSPTNSLVTRLPVYSRNYCGYGYTNQVATEFTINVAGRSLGVWSIHLNADSTDARLYEIGVLQGCLTSMSANIVAGDYNMQAASGEYWTMVGPGYTDAWDMARNLGTNYNYYGNCDGCTRNSRIDYIFSTTSAWYLNVQSGQMIDTRDANGYMPSDHKPFVITYTVQ
jgi:endonuclease/exonuclease/phosphatase family metal-dependent hydrolase/predicted small secreted protein